MKSSTLAHTIRHGVFGMVSFLLACQPGVEKEAGLAPEPVPEVTDLTLSPAAVVIETGGSQSFTVSALLSSGETITPPVTWNATGGSISASGVFTAGGAAGSYRVIATVAGGGPADTSAITVPAAPVTLTGMSLNPGTISLQTGATQQFSVSGTWSDGGIASPVVSYSATGGAVTVGGLYTAGTTPGAYRVIAVHAGGSLSDTSSVTVQAPPAATLTSLSMTPASVSLQVGAVQQFTVAATWSDGGTSVPAVTYTATGGTVSGSGSYTAGATPGSFRVIVASSSRADTSTVTVVAPPAATLNSLVLTPASVSLSAGATRQFNVAATWSDGGTAVPPVTYSATGGTISTGGLFTAGSTAGAFVVIVSHNGGSLADTSAVTVIVPVTLTALVMTPATVSLNTGTTQQFSVVANWSDGGTTVPTLSYTASGGTVSAGGLYTAGSTAGSFRLIVSANGWADTSAVTISVPAATLTALVLTPSSVTLNTNTLHQFSVSATWSDGGTTVPAVTFSATGGSVIPNGQYTAGTTAGTFRVIVSANGRADTSAVTITAPAVTISSIALTPGSVSLATDATQQYSATATMSDGSTQSNPTLTWTATGGTIDGSRLYRAGSTGGTFRVVAISTNGRADTSLVTLTSPTATVSSVSVTPGSISLNTGASQTFTVVATMSDGSTQTNPAMTWSATGGTISGSRVYTAGSTAGSFRVIASSNGHADTSSVTVTTPPPVGANNMYFNSAESGCGTDSNVLLCDDFEDGDWYTKNCDQANSSGGLLQTDGWCGTIYGPLTAAACGNAGVRSDCAASHGVATGGQGGVTYADHSLSQAASEIYVRFYTKPQTGYLFGAEKLLTFNKGSAGVGGIFFGNLHINCGGGGGSSSGTLQWQPTGGESGCRNVIAMTPGKWYFIEVHINTAAGVLQVWADDCGATGNSCTGSPTLRLNLSGYNLPAGTIGSLWWENWANPGSSGNRLLDQVKVSRAGPIGYAQ